MQLEPGQTAVVTGSASGIGFGLATSFAILIFARMWVGALEANSSAAISLIGDYWPVEQRATKMSLYQLGNLF